MTSSTDPLRGGTHYARRAGLRTVTVHLTPAEHDGLVAFALSRGWTLKGMLRSLALREAGIPDPRGPADPRGGGHVRRGRVQ